jgi:hypothetical protein
LLQRMQLLVLTAALLPAAMPLVQSLHVMM